MVLLKTKQEVQCMLGVPSMISTSCFDKMIMWEVTGQVKVFCFTFAGNRSSVTHRICFSYPCTYLTFCAICMWLLLAEVISPIPCFCEKNN